jgi:hypothetical protein
MSIQYGFLYLIPPDQSQFNSLVTLPVGTEQLFSKLHVLILAVSCLRPSIATHC